MRVHDTLKFQAIIIIILFAQWNTTAQKKLKLKLILIKIKAGNSSNFMLADLLEIYWKSSLLIC